MFRKPLIYALLLGTALGASSLEASAQKLRFTSQSDALTLDPHAQNEGPTITHAQQIHDPLIIRDDEMGIREGLAVSWETVEPTLWELKLREGVKFHHARDFTAG